MGKELLMHDDLNVRKKKKFISESHLVIQRDANYVTVRSKKKLLYAVVLLCGEREPKGEGKAKERATDTATITERNNYTRVLSALKHASDTCEANLKYYVSLANGQCKLKKIHLLDCSQMVWDFQFFKKDLHRRIKYAQRSKSLCFVLSPRLLLREYSLFVSGLIRRLGRGSPSRDQQKTPFLQKIWSILSLLKEENTNLRNIYHLEHYTKIFLHNCDKLNRKLFISFLKKINHLHVHAVNLNTLFGLYFSETEENILKVFRKCERRRRPRRRAAAQREYNDEGNTGHNLCKEDNPARGVQKKKHSPEVDLYKEDSDYIGRSSTDEGTKKTLKRKKLATHVTYDIKQLAKIYKEKHIQLMRRKKKNISIIVLSDLDLKHFDISLTRAGRFFHFIKYA
ncbi:hypothetical protein PCYB_083640 [Plasmodium cynomolgi strain B]|uniref:Uncharacterized protein n=1 Tax=Plasmodium cynomolgi (strain B) TaxID=1120755 RepID=K6UJS8_PLACD|nr:hypothetical protein PCYB_083640 [Plasmodium cynomolgi strain B]GAB66203.1 hypothetical protein PCYB_083640 [Plasmodium cynomolgi strain B]